MGHEKIFEMVYLGLFCLTPPHPPTKKTPLWQWRFVGDDPIPQNVVISDHIVSNDVIMSNMSIQLTVDCLILWLVLY